MFLGGLLVMVWQLLQCVTDNYLLFVYHWPVSVLVQGSSEIDKPRVQLAPSSTYSMINKSDHVSTKNSDALLLGLQRLLTFFCLQHAVSTIIVWWRQFPPRLVLQGAYQCTRSKRAMVAVMSLSDALLGA